MAHIRPSTHQTTNIHVLSCHNQVNAAAAGLAAGIKSELGLSRRSCVGICLENGPEWLITDTYSLRVSGVPAFNEINHRYVYLLRLGT
jgi:long-subunit acyl-CoA synthetase (AMP-forming)